MHIVKPKEKADNKEVKKNKKIVYDEDDEEKLLRVWIEAIIQKPMAHPKLLKSLNDGTVLCIFFIAIYRSLGISKKMPFNRQPRGIDFMVKENQKHVHKEYAKLVKFLTGNKEKPLAHDHDFLSSKTSGRLIAAMHLLSTLLMVHDEYDGPYLEMM